MDILTDKSPTLTTTHYGTPDVCYSAQLGMLERFGGHFYEEMSPTLQADSTGDNKPVVVYGCDLGATRDVGELFIEECSKTLTNGSCPGHHNHVVICIEGNGSRPSHQGDGYKVSEQMYTMNTTEVHAVCYAEKRFFDWEEDDTSVTIRNKGGSYGGGQKSSLWKRHGKMICTDIVGTLDTEYRKVTSNQIVANNQLVVEVNDTDL